MPIYVCGHKNPDTDSVISAIGLCALRPFGLEEYIPVRTGEINKETQYLLKRFGLDAPKLLPEGEKKVILVDHNSPEEMCELIQPSEIIGIYDHHKLSGPFTDEPIEVLMRPIGSTCSLIAGLMQKYEIEPGKNLAGALLGGILSDTLKFTSPTTTDEDRGIAAWLNRYAEVDIEIMAEEMFAAKSDISDIKTEELITKDYKVFEMGGQKVGIGVWETVKPQTILGRKKEILEKLKEKRDGLDYIYFAAIDILKQTAYFFLASEKEREAAKNVFGGKLKEDTLEVSGIVSRKKQIVPSFEKYFA